MGKRRTVGRAPLTQYQMLDGRTIRPVPVKVHLLNGLQAAIESGVPVIVILCDGLVLQATNQHQVDTVLKRAEYLRAFRSECWRVKQWIDRLGIEQLEKLLITRPRTFTRNQTELLMNELRR